MKKRMSDGGVPLVIKTIAIDAIPIEGEEEPVALMTLADADGGETEYVMSPEGARMMIAAMESYLDAIKKH